LCGWDYAPVKSPVYSWMILTGGTGKSLFVAREIAGERMPLPVDAGRALVAYLHSGRSLSVDGCRLFLHARPPLQGLNPGAVSNIVSRAFLASGPPRDRRAWVAPHRSRKAIGGRRASERGRSVAPSPRPADYRNLRQGQPGCPRDCCPLLAGRYAVKTLRRLACRLADHAPCSRPQTRTSPEIAGPSARLSPQHRPCAFSSTPRGATLDQCGRQADVKLTSG